METHTYMQDVQGSIPNIILCNRGFFFSFLYVCNVFLHFKKEQGVPGCQFSFLRFIGVFL